MNLKAQPDTSANKQRILDSKVKLRRIDNLIFIICIIIAIVFWSLIKLSETYSESYTLKVSYTNVPEDKKLTSLDDSTVALTITAYGHTILWKWFWEDLKNLPIDLEDFNIDRREADHYFVYTQEMKEELANRLKLPEASFELSKTTLGFVLDDLKEKKVRVVEKLDLKFKQEYDLYEKATMTPEEVVVYGPAIMLDTLIQLSTESIQRSLIDSDLTLEVKIKNPAPDMLRLSPETVTVNLRVEKYTESSIEIPVDFSGIKQQIKSFPTTVKINFKIARKDFNLVQSGQFQVVPEIEGVDIQNSDRLHLRLVRQPEIIRNPWIVPADIEYLIIK